MVVTDADVLSMTQKNLGTAVPLFCLHLNLVSPASSFHQSRARPGTRFAPSPPPAGSSAPVPSKDGQFLPCLIEKTAGWLPAAKQAGSEPGSNVFLRLRGGKFREVLDYVYVIISRRRSGDAVCSSLIGSKPLRELNTNCLASGIEGSSEVMPGAMRSQECCISCEFFEGGGKIKTTHEK